MMFAKDEIISKIEREIPSLLNSYHFSFMVLFGSVSEGKAGWWSDIDIVIGLPNFENIQVQELHGYKIKLAVLIDQIINTDKVQISIWESLPPHVKFNAIKTGIPIYVENEKEFQQIKEQTIIEYWDHMIWYKQALNIGLTEEII